MARNPAAKVFRVLGTTQSAWDGLLTTVRDYLSAQDDREELSDAELIALDTQLRDPRLFNALKSELGISD